MIIKEKPIENPIIEKTIDDKIELIKSVSEVKSRIRDVITEDFVLSKLEEKDKEYIIEMTNNAFLSRKIINRIKNGHIWEWKLKGYKFINKEGEETILKKDDYVKRGLNDNELTLIEKNKQECFDSYMTKIYMINITNRNKAKNYIIEKMTGIKDEEDDEETRLKSITKKVKDRLGVKDDE